MLLLLSSSSSRGFIGYSVAFAVKRDSIITTTTIHPHSCLTLIRSHSFTGRQKDGSLLCPSERNDRRTFSTRCSASSVCVAPGGGPYSRKAILYLAAIDLRATRPSRH